MKATIEQLRQQTRDKVAAANAPRQKVVCAHCGASTFPDASGCCEYCGGALTYATS